MTDTAVIDIGILLVMHCLICLLGGAGLFHIAGCSLSRGAGLLVGTWKVSGVVEGEGIF